ncbi:hypothetical protein PG991_009508 [Apiospora marii]|uniref:Uncharacterized protein n=1 Tax=Apiospora marii TaxID=335849 RepID=A0ABR1RJV9_9PEZI
MAATTTMGDPSTSATRGRGPLTTVFTMPDFCQQPWWTYRDAPAVSSSVCMPGNWVDYYGNRRGFYSPGICPQGYTEGCYLPATAARVGENGKPWHGGPILPGETARICCPAGYSCFRDTTTSADIQWRKCITTAVDPLTTYAHNRDGTTTITVTTPALAFGIQVRWQSSDLSILETNPTVPGAKYTGAPPPPHDPGNSDDKGGAGPSTTTVIVVGVVVPLVSLILGILAFWYWRHHYRTKYKPTETEDRHNNIDTSYSSTTKLSGHSPGFAGVPTHDQDQDHDRGMEKEMGVVGAAGRGLSNRNNNNNAQAHAYPNANPNANEMDASVVYEADADTHPWMELPAGDVPAAQEMPATSFVAELADTSVAPYRRQDSIAQSIATSHDFEGSSARRKSLRDGGGNGSSLHERKFSWDA